MTWSLPLFKVKGTVVRLHFTFLLFLVWIGAAAFAHGGGRAAFQEVALLVALFLCVLLHEFGHVFAARRYGIVTPDITLLPIGGVARLERLPEKPAQELIVALAGPAVNLVIALVLMLVAGGTVSETGMELASPAVGFLASLVSVNVFLAVFNLIPAFPMDGGRVLRALLTFRLGYVRATHVAAIVGEALALGLGVLGLFGNPILIFVAVFVFIGAASESHAVKLREAARGLIAGEAAVTALAHLSPLSSVDEAVQTLLRTAQHEFPIVDGGGRLRGVLTRNAMIAALRSQGPATPVMEVMRGDIPLVRDRAPLADAMRLLQESDAPAIGVTDVDGRFIGLITPENLGKLMMVHALRTRAGTPNAN